MGRVLWGGGGVIKSYVLTPRAFLRACLDIFFSLSENHILFKVQRWKIYKFVFIILVGPRKDFFKRGSF